MINSFNANSGICGLDSQGKVDSAKLIGQIDTAQLAGDAVNGDKIDDDAVDSEHIVTGAVDYDHISFGSTATDLGGSTPANNLVPTQAATKSYVDTAVGDVDVSSSIEQFALNEWEGIQVRDNGYNYGISEINNGAGYLPLGSSNYSQYETHRHQIYRHPLAGDGSANTHSVERHHGEGGNLCTFGFQDSVSNKYTGIGMYNRQTRDAIVEISGSMWIDVRTSSSSLFRLALQLGGTTVKTMSLPSNYNRNESYELTFQHAQKVSNMGSLNLRFYTYHTSSSSYYSRRKLENCVIKITYL
jgi:hypothetical protein